MNGAMRLRCTAAALFVLCIAAPFCAAAGMRVVSLAPSLTEMADDLGYAEQLVGAADDPCAEKEGSPGASLPKVGPYHRPSLERIAALRPDLCLAVADGTPESLIRRLEKLGIAVDVYRIATLDELASAYGRLGKRLDAGEKASAIEALIRGRIAGNSAGKERPGLKPRVLFAVQCRPLMAAGKNTFAASLLEHAGFENAVKTEKGYPVVSREKLFGMKPDFILDASPEGNVGEILPGGIRVIRVDPADFSRPSLRALKALDALEGLR